MKKIKPSNIDQLIHANSTLSKDIRRSHRKAVFRALFNKREVKNVLKTHYGVEWNTIDKFMKKVMRQTYALDKLINNFESFHSLAIIYCDKTIDSEPYSIK